MSHGTQARLSFEYENDAYTKSFEVSDIVAQDLEAKDCVTISVTYANGDNHLLQIARRDFKRFTRECQRVAAEAAL